MEALDSVRKAIREESLAGWLFCGFRHRDPIADRIMGIPATTVNSRPWFAVAFPDRPPLLIVHTVESHILDHIEGERLFYTGREELTRIFGSYAGKTFAAQISRDNPVLSTLDYGTASLLRRCGISLRESGGLIQRILGLLSETEIARHEKAAAHLYRIVEGAWGLVKERLSSGTEVREGEIQDWILAEFVRRRLVTDHPPIVAFGAGSADPHYEPAGRGGLISSPGVLQFDLWAKEDDPTGIYADISWVAVCSAEPSAEEERVFQTVIGARDHALAFIGQRLTAGRPDTPPTGAEVDAEVRRFIEAAGFGAYLRHRTGHGIDRDVHGFGVNLDSVEFPDHRKLLPGSCFSIEPGVYTRRFGMRTEIDVYITENGAVVSGGPVQTELLRL